MPSRVGWPSNQPLSLLPSFPVASVVFPVAAVCPGRRCVWIATSTHVVCLHHLGNASKQLTPGRPSSASINAFCPSGILGLSYLFSPTIAIYFYFQIYFPASQIFYLYTPFCSTTAVEREWASTCCVSNERQNLFYEFLYELCIFWTRFPNETYMKIHPENRWLAVSERHRTDVEILSKQCSDQGRTYDVVPVSFVRSVCEHKKSFTGSGQKST